MSCVYCHSLWISLIYDVQKRGKIAVLLVRAVYAVVNSNKPHAFLCKEDFSVKAYVAICE